jgi:hypothetical protein
MSQEWEIKPCQHVCAATGQPFEDQQRIYSRLVFTPEGYVRADYSEAGWTDGAKKGAVSFWKSVYHAPAPPAPEPMKKETAEMLLRQFMAREDFSRKNAIYILAVMLERKRVLVERDVQMRPDGLKLRIYEHKKTGEIFTVPDPGLRLDELESVQAEVNELLGLTPPKPAEPAAPGSGE